MSNKRLLFFYDYFYPGYKAGGPIQSLTNLSVALTAQYEVNLITTAYDFGSKKAYDKIEINKWNKVILPGSDKAINVYYSDYKSLNKKAVQELIEVVSPKCIYLNGMFSYRFFLLPLLILKNTMGDYKIIICPRGMLQKGALSGKTIKKKLYLTYIKLARLLTQVRWHATTKDEAIDITTFFPDNKGIVVAPNIPKVPYVDITYPVKETGKIKLVYLSLISAHKNVLLLLELIQKSFDNITLDIYGPVTDEAYWKQCKQLIQQMPGKVQYKGDVQPADVQNVMSQYDAFISLTKGENFGHALYESLSVGRPVITSHFTPWNDLQQQKAGVNVDIADKNDCLNKLHDFASLNQDEYNNYCNGAHRLATKYYNELDAVRKYRELFGS